jgi:salicylate hydroxylase
VAPPHHVIVAGAGIAGLSAALAMERAGFQVTLMEQAERLEEAGAGLQLSPNSTRVLESLGLGAQLQSVAMAPEAIRIMAGRSAREIARIPLGRHAVKRYGAPYLTLHRADLQQVLLDGVRARPGIALKLGVRVENFTTQNDGASVHGERGIALIGADGMWSALRARHAGMQRPRFVRRTAWRAVLPAEGLPATYRAPFVNLWLGPDAHLVHYPVKSGKLVNVVGIVGDDWNEPGWSAPGNRDTLLRHFARWTWSNQVREFLSLPQRWLKWALHDGGGPIRNGKGPLTLIGDAAHPMLPFLAQGAGMAIEDAAVLAVMLGKRSDDPAAELRGYESARFHRIERVQTLSRRQGRIYGMTGPEAVARNAVMMALGGERLLTRLDWLYNWRAPEFTAAVCRPT